MTTNTSTVIQLWLVNDSGNDLEVTGVRGSDISLNQPGGILLPGAPFPKIIPAHGVAFPFAMFTDSTIFENNWDWIDLKDRGTGALYQLYVESNWAEVRGVNALFGYRDNYSSKSDPNPQPMPDGYASAQWIDATTPANQRPVTATGSPGTFVLYTLHKTPPVPPTLVEGAPIADSTSSDLYVVRASDNHLMRFAPVTPPLGPTSTWQVVDVSAAAPATPLVEGRPAVFTDGQGLTQAFAREKDTHHLVDVFGPRSAMDASWSMLRVSDDWGVLDGDPIRDLNSGRLYAVGANHHLIWTYFSASSTSYGYGDLTSQAAGQPEVQGTPAVFVLGTSVQVFARGTNNHLVQFYTPDQIAEPWQAFDMTGATGSAALDGDPVAAAQVVFAIGANHHLMLFSWAQGSNWSMTDLTAIGPYNLQFVGTPSVSVGSDQSIQVFAHGIDDHLYEVFHPASTDWQTWQATDLSGQFTNALIGSNPFATSQDVYAVRAGHLLDFHWTPSGWVFSDLTDGTSSDVAVQTANPPSVTIVGSPRPDLAGARIQQIGLAPIYLVDDDGTLRHIPDPTTYTNLFRDWSGVQQLADVTGIARGLNLSSGAYLAWVGPGNAVYLVANSQKRWISGPAVMDKFAFNWNQIRMVLQSTLDALPNGPGLT